MLINELSHVLLKIAIVEMAIFFNLFFDQVLECARLFFGLCVSEMNNYEQFCLHIC